MRRIGKVHEGSKRRNLGPMFILLHSMTQFFERDADVSSSETNIPPYLTTQLHRKFGETREVSARFVLASWAPFAVGSCSMFDCTNEACPFNGEVSRSILLSGIVNRKRLLVHGGVVRSHVLT